jgi:hypothetical protein
MIISFRILDVLVNSVETVKILASNKAAVSSFYAVPVFHNYPQILSLQYKLKIMSLGTDWIGKE